MIASSPTDIQAVLDTIAENAARLCEAQDAVINTVAGGMIEGDVAPLAAKYGPIPAAPARVAHQSGHGVRTGAPRAPADPRPGHRGSARGQRCRESHTMMKLYGIRTVLAAPLLRKGVPIGGIVIREWTFQPFTEKQSRAAARPLPIRP